MHNAVKKVSSYAFAHMRCNIFADVNVRPENNSLRG